MYKILNERFLKINENYNCRDDFFTWWGAMNTYRANNPADLKKCELELSLNIFP